MTQLNSYRPRPPVIVLNQNELSILKKVGNRQTQFIDLVDVYADAIAKERKNHRINWQLIDQVIISRWSKKVLNTIKKEALNKL